MHYTDAHVQGLVSCFIVNIPRPPSGRSTPVSGSPNMQRKDYRVQTSQNTGNKVTMNPTDCSQAISRLCLTEPAGHCELGRRRIIAQFYFSTNRQLKKIKTGSWRSSLNRYLHCVIYLLLYSISDNRFV